MAKETKQSLINTMKGFLVNTDEKVKEVVNYVVKSYEENPRNMTMADIQESLQIVKNMVNPTFLPVEASLKKADKKKTLKKSEEDLLSEIEEGFEEVEENEEDGEEEVAVEVIEKEEPKAVEKKKLSPKKETEKADKPKTEKKVAKKEELIKVVEMAVAFPETLDSPLGKLQIRREVADIKELYKYVMDEERQFVCCVYWNKRQLKQFNYDVLGICEKYPTNFKDDLDLVDLVYVSPKGSVAYGVSQYTEVGTAFTPAEFATDEETGMRYQNGAEYQIYEIVE